MVKVPKFQILVKNVKTLKIEQIIGNTFQNI